jgi:hypothetical protein
MINFKRIDFDQYIIGIIKYVNTKYIIIEDLFQVFLLGDHMTKHLPCVDCKQIVVVRMKLARTVDAVPVLCEACLEVRVARVKTERDLKDITKCNPPLARSSAS